MKRLFTERNIVVALFVIALVTFSLAQEDTRKMEQQYSTTTSVAVISSLNETPGNAGNSNQQPAKTTLIRRRTKR